MGPLALTAAMAVALLAACSQKPAQQQAAPPTTVVVTVTQPAPAESSDNAEPEEPAKTSSSREPEAEDGMACGSEQLRARFYPDTIDGLQAGRSQAPDGTGTYHTILRIANVGANPCGMEGGVRIEFLGSGGESLRTEVEEVTHAVPEAISIGTRQAVGQDLWWKYNVGECIYPAKVHVYPPKSSRPITLDWPLGGICDDGHLETGLFFPN
ncbi:DUF4232 domain-containing protein [Saccharopolyspora sp. 5N102]|uniref:DUF4232 domain-containing protein n=1 Tax=Saccharopolyspora sp. 5N102 TaxID=3375155 RepID=UPI00378C3168